jgi:hypothetical protein
MLANCPVCNRSTTAAVHGTPLSAVRLYGLYLYALTLTLTQADAVTLAYTVVLRCNATFRKAYNFSAIHTLVSGRDQMQLAPADPAAPAFWKS